MLLILPPSPPHFVRGEPKAGGEIAEGADLVAMTLLARLPGCEGGAEGGGRNGEENLLGSEGGASSAPRYGALSGSISRHTSSIDFPPQYWA